MNMANENNLERSRYSRQKLRFLLLLLSLPMSFSCQDTHNSTVLPASFPFTGSGVQEGEITVQEGMVAMVRYKKPYQSPPQLRLLELRGADAKERLYCKDDFQIVQQEAAFFKIQNNHMEHGESWATIKWRAEGVLAKEPPTGLDLTPEQLASSGRTAQEWMIEKIKKAGGKATADPNQENAAVQAASRVGNTIEVSLDVTKKNYIVTIDLHRTRITDADLVPFESLPYLHSLNVYDTAISDVGLKSISKMTALQILYLNKTKITDSGLSYLQSLTKLSDLGLNQTQIGDQGLAYLKNLTNLHNLSLGATQVTDQGLMQLKGIKTLKHLYVRGSKVTANGVKDLKKALPNVQIIQ